MSHDPSNPAWPGQQPTSFDPFTGKPVYAAPEPAPQQYGQQPQQPQYGQPQAPQYGQPPAPQYGAPPQPHYGAPPQQQYGAPPPQPQYGQPPAPQYPPQQQQPYGAPPPQQQGYQQQQHGGYPQAPQGAYGHAHRISTPPDEEESGGLRGTANATVAVSDRKRFIRLTYLHLLGAILAFVFIEAAFFRVGFLMQHVTIPLVRFAVGIEQAVPRWHWGVVLGAFMVVSWLADYWASHTTSRAMQYVGLGLYVLAEALIFVPLIAIVMAFSEILMKGGGANPHILRDAGIATGGIFTVLTLFVVLGKKDFSFIRGALGIASGAAMLLVALSLISGFNLGIVFCIGMVVLAAGYILYQTSQVLAHYNTENYVAASLALFSSVALMFWYMIQIFMRARSN